MRGTVAAEDLRGIGTDDRADRRSPATAPPDRRPPVVGGSVLGNAVERLGRERARLAAASPDDDTVVFATWDSYVS